MIQGQIEKLLKALGAKETHADGGWVNCSCPMAPFTHKGGTDSKPSFGIHIDAGKSSHFNCWSCARSGTLEELIGVIEMGLKNRPELKPKYDLKSARAYLADEELVVEPLPEWAEVQASKSAEFEEWPQWFIETFPPVGDVQVAIDYLIDREVTQQMAEAMDLRWDPEREMIVAPYRTMYGKLAGARGRCINPKRGLQHYDYTYNKINNADLCWYGEDAFLMDMPVVVVEGQFDCMRVREVYPACIAALSSKVTPYKMKKLAAADAVLLFLDLDKTGVEAAPKWAEYLLSQDVMVGMVDYPMEYDPLKKVDPGKLTLEQIKEAIGSLTPVPS